MKIGLFTYVHLDEQELLDFNLVYHYIKHYIKYGIYKIININFKYNFYIYKSWNYILVISCVKG